MSPGFSRIRLFAFFLAFLRDNAGFLAMLLPIPFRFLLGSS